VTLHFGTDGVRGPADTLTDTWVKALGVAAALVLGPGRFVVGRDTRLSGPRIATALSDGLRAGGCDVVDLGVAPTPAVAWAAADGGWAGAVVSASHNPWSDNGVKLFAPGGTKLDDATEQRLSDALVGVLAAGSGGGSAHNEAATEGSSSLLSSPLPDGDELLQRYIGHLAASLHGRRLDGLSVVLDCANGAASAIAPGLFSDLGAAVEVLHADPDGRNINHECGSTHLGDLSQAVQAAGADIGLAFDGDADRVLAVDGDGATVDGDQMIAMLAIDRHQRGVLEGDAVVVTVMSNLGLRLAMDAAGIDVVETPVGDRHCLAELEARGLVLGGEQSGHVILRDLATTGDGMLSGLQLADLIVRCGRPLADLAAGAMTRLPQVLRNVAVVGDVAAIVAAVAPLIDQRQQQLDGTGRILVRPSGTEPLIRVMVEAPDEAEAHSVAGYLCDAIAEAAKEADR